MTPADAAISSLLAASCVVAAASRRWPVAAALAALCVLGGARLVATPILDAAAEPYVGAARWALAAEVVALAWWPWVTAALCWAVVRPGKATAGGVRFGSRHPPAAAPRRLHAEQDSPSLRPRPAQALLLAAGSLAASCALAAAYPWLQGPALVGCYAPSRVAALVVVAGVVWRRLRVERVGGSAEVVARDESPMLGATPIRGAANDLGATGESTEHEGGERLHAPSVALRDDEIPALALAAEQLAQLVLWQLGPSRIAGAWPAVEVVSIAGYGALLVVLVGQAVRRRG